MIPDILDCKKLITHDNCPDGLGSAMIIAAAIPKIEIEFYHHNSKEHNELKVEDGMLFCDFVPPSMRAEEFVEAGAIVLDHHIHAKDIVSKFGEHGIFGSETQSGASLAFHHVYEFKVNSKWSRAFYDNTYLFQERVAIRDTWQKDNKLWKQSCIQGVALLAIDRDELLNEAREGKSWLASEQLEIGKAFYNNHCKKVEFAAFNSYKTIIKDKSVAIFNDGDKLISDVAETLRKEGVDICVGFSYITVDGHPKILYSLRSVEEDVGALCKKMGGGGHRRAAGFKMPIGSMNPFQHIKKIIKDNYNLLGSN